jgi:hypothetical protein
MRTRRMIAAAATLASITWGAAASAAPQVDVEPVQAPVVVPHTMSSCGNMDGF